VIEARAARAAQEARAHRISPRRARGCAQDRDAARLRHPREARPARAVVVADALARALVERGGRAPLPGDPSVGRVARHPDVNHAARVRRDHEAGAEWAQEGVARAARAWLRKKVAPVCPRGRGSRGRAKEVWMVRCAARIPSFPSAPRIRSVPQRGWSAASRWIRATVPADSGGRPGPGRDLRRQHDRKPARYQRSSVSGRARSRACRQARTRPASSTRSARSAGVRIGRVTLWCKTSSCWRNSAFSASSCPRVRARSVPVPVRCAAAGRGQQHVPRACRPRATSPLTGGFITG